MKSKVDPLKKTFRIKEKDGIKTCPRCNNKLEIRRDIGLGPSIKRRGKYGYSIMVCSKCGFWQ